MKTSKSSTGIKKTEKLNLFEDQFMSHEAREILINIFQSKIQYYKLKNYSSQVQFEKDDSQAQKRIPMLNGELKKLKDILADAQAKNQNVVIHSDISISLVDKK